MLLVQIRKKKNFQKIFGLWSLHNDSPLTLSKYQRNLMKQFLEICLKETSLNPQDPNVKQGSKSLSLKKLWLIFSYQLKVLKSFT